MARCFFGWRRWTSREPPSGYGRQLVAEGMVVQRCGEISISVHVAAGIVDSGGVKHPMYLVSWARVRVISSIC